MRHNKAGVVLLVLLLIAVAAIIVFLAIGNARQQSQIAQLQHDRDLLEIQNTGPQGVAGKNATDAEVLKAVETYCAAHNDCAGVAGVAGAKGATGPAGKVGPKGATGDSVAGVRCNGTSISFLDSSGRVLGTVKMVCIE